MKRSFPSETMDQHMCSVTLEVAELATRLTDNNLRVVDASVVRAEGQLWSTMPGKQDFLAAHIPGAQYLDLLIEFSDASAQHGLAEGLRAFGLPSVEQFTTAARRHGISNDTTIVAYDTVQGQWASRVWWLFTYFGHDNVFVLDGGFDAWVAANLPVETGDVALPQYGSFVAQVRRELLATKTDVVAATKGERDDVVMNVLSPEVFRGEIESDMPRKGRIPHSINVPYTTLVNPDGTLKPDDELRTLFASHGIDGTRPVITYCGAGIGATRNALALRKLGIDVSVYDGSLIEWTSDPTLDVHVGKVTQE